MGDKTSIEWTDATWNPTTGCDRISSGCDNCYALPMAARLKLMGQANYQTDGDPATSGPGFGVATHPHMLDQPLRWKRPRRIFVNSMSDLFHTDVPVEFIASVFAVMACAHQHTFQVLTKRPQRMAALLSDAGDGDTFVARVELAIMEMVDQGIVRLADDSYQGLLPVPGSSTDELLPWPLSNVWLGTSIETDKYSWRANHLRNTPAAVRFISAEPLLGPLPRLDLDGIDWLIAGGESGPGARPMHPQWARDLRDECLAQTCSFHFKQWGAWAPIDGDGVEFGRWVDGLSGDTYSTRADGRVLMSRFGKRDAGRELDGRTWDEFPTAPAEALR